MRLILMLLTVALAAPWSSFPARGAATMPRPNIIFILADDLGWRDLGCFGSTFHETPNLDTLAASGLRFTDAYAACNVCSPTRASILTGKYPARLHLTDWLPGRPDRRDQKLKRPAIQQHLPLEEVTIAEALKEAGYATAFLGKWHLGGTNFLPEDQGFDLNVGGCDKGHPPSYFSPYKIPNLPDGPKGEYLTDRLTDEALKFIDSAKDKPFFLYLSHYAVHNPQQAKPELIAKYQAKAARLPNTTGPEFIADNGRQVRQIQNQPVYAAMLQSLDESVGRIRSKLAELKLDRNTILVFTSDNGGLSTAEGSPTANVPLRAGKGWPYEGGVREPLLVHWPGVTRPGTVCRQPIISTDYYPTFLQMAGLPLRPRQHLDGTSFVPLCKGDDLPERPIFWHYPHYSNQGGGPGGAVRLGNYKLIEWFEDMRVELFNLKDDLGEQHNLASKLPKKAGALQELLHHWRENVDAQMMTPYPGYDPEATSILPKRALLDAEIFWDNRDWDWYKQNIPFFHCPDADINTTYYYRWELVTKHLTYGSPESGYSFTEFIDRPFWSGAYGAISCPAGHQLYEVRWLRDKRYAQDYARYWFRTPGAQPRRYSTWLADAVWGVHLAQPDEAFTKDLLPDLIKNYEGWEKSHFVPEMGLFWQIGHDDGMELNINSRQTRDIVRGAPGFRPSFNAYMWADAQAIARIAALAGDKPTADKYRTKAGALKSRLQSLLWDPKRDFFFHMFKQDEQRDDFKVKALTLTHQSGQFADSPRGRELIGYVPWQFNLPDRRYVPAWKFLTERDYFAADFGPLTVERNDPLFKISPTCCWWSGQSWPYATTQTLKALANLLQQDKQQFITRADYFKLLKTYTLTQRKNGIPYIAEAAHPDTGSWTGHDSYNHSEHYFHSAYCDLIITGLIGLKPRADDSIEIDPLAPVDWNYFALDDLWYHGHRVSIVWDKDGHQFGTGAGLQIFMDGNKLASSPKLGPLTARMRPASITPEKKLIAVNYAVNNGGQYFPRFSASFAGKTNTLAKLNDGNYWYHLHPPNRWTTEGSTNTADWVTVDFGVERKVHNAKLYLLDDAEKVVAPAAFDLEYWTGEGWKAVPNQRRTPEQPTGHRPNTIDFPELATAQIRAVFKHRQNGRTGLSEFEVWGDTTLPISKALSDKSDPKHP